MSAQTAEVEPLLERPPGSAWRPVFRALGTVAGPLIGLALVLTVFGIWQPDTFLSPMAFRNVFQNNYHILIAAIGATFVIITAGIDLSVGSTMALASVICAMSAAGLVVPAFDWQRGSVIAGGAAVIVALCVLGCALQFGWTKSKLIARASIGSVLTAIFLLLGWLLLRGHAFPELPIPLALVAGIACGAGVGAFNGILITSLTLPPFIVTLATLGAIRGLTLYITSGLPVTIPSDVEQRLAALHYHPAFLGISTNLWIAIVVAAISIPLLHTTILGRYSYAIGSNEQTARLCGVRVERWKIICYMIAGSFAGLAGALMTSTLGGRPSDFEGLELNAIAAVVIGGTSLFGGEGTVIGSILGVLMLGFLNTGCTLAGLSSYVQPIFIGFTIVIAAAIDRFRHLAT